MCIIYALILYVFVGGEGESAQNVSLGRFKWGEN